MEVVLIYPKIYRMAENMFQIGLKSQVSQILLSSVFLIHLRNNIYTT